MFLHKSEGMTLEYVSANHFKLEGAYISLYELLEIFEKEELEIALLEMKKNNKSKAHFGINGFFIFVF
jgi:hypothetical protein